MFSKAVLAPSSYTSPKKDPFRVALTNKIPISWPYDSTPGASKSDVVDEALQRKILEALKKFEIKFYSMTVQKLWQRGLPETGEDTIIIRTRDTDTTHWQTAVNHIYGIGKKDAAYADIIRWGEATYYHFGMVRKAAARAGTRMGVEIQNPVRRYSDLSSPIMPGTAAHRCFSRIQPIAEAEVRRNCSNMCTSIAYHNRQHKVPTTDSIKQPTVIVYVAPGSFAHWAVVEAHIQQAIEAIPFKEDVEIALEILPGFNIPSATGHATTTFHPQFQQGPVPAPTLSASIGPQLSTTDSGSIGALVNFQPRDGEPQKCFLTAYHVVASGDPTGRAINDEFGIGLDGREVSQRIEVTYPARCDVAAPDQNRETASAADLGATTEKGCMIGEVIHASGLRHNDRRRRMNWALVALYSSGCGDAVLNSLPPRSAFSMQCLENGVLAYEIETGETISQTGKLEKNSWVGRSFLGMSRAIAGGLNSMERTVFWANGMVSREVEVLQVDARKRFTEDRDVGLLVFNEARARVGMVVGADSGYAGYLTAAADIIADIEARTGGTITLI